MKNKNLKKGGYAILFTVIVVSIITMISMGLANTALKQMILSGVARDSTTAFYEADFGSECILYAENISFVYDNPATILASDGKTFDCSGRNLIYTARVIGNNPTVVEYKFTPGNESTSEKCFRATIKKTDQTDKIETVVLVSGYNICNINNLRTVERTLEIKY